MKNHSSELDAALEELATATAALQRTCDLEMPIGLGYSRCFVCGERDDLNYNRLAQCVLCPSCRVRIEERLS